MTERTIDKFNAGRKPDREALALAFTTIANAHGAEVERADVPAHVGWCGAGIDLRFKLAGVGASLSIDNLHGGATGLISWYNVRTPGRKTCNFSVRFALKVGDGGAIRGGRPHHKATSCGGGWYELALALDAGLLLAASGDAFEQPAA